MFSYQVVHHSFDSTFVSYYVNVRLCRNDIFFDIDFFRSFVLSNCIDTTSSSSSKTDPERVTLHVCRCIFIRALRAVRRVVMNREKSTV